MRRKPCSDVLKIVNCFPKSAFYSTFADKMASYYVTLQLKEH